MYSVVIHVFQSNNIKFSLTEKKFHGKVLHHLKQADAQL